MFTISAQITFRAGHYLTLPNGRTEKPHQHDWTVAALVRASVLDEHGLVMDFHVLIAELRTVVEPLEQAGCINDLAEFSTDQPSTERLASYVYEKLAELLPQTVELTEVRVAETQNCWAAYRRSPRHKVAR